MIHFMNGHIKMCYFSLKFLCLRIKEYIDNYKIHNWYHIAVLNTSFNKQTIISTGLTTFKNSCGRKL